MRSSSRWPRGPVWHAMVALVFLLAGAMFATSAQTARGTDLRSERRLRLADAIRAQERRASLLEAEAATLRRDVARRTGEVARGDRRVGAAESAADALRAAAGLTPLAGPGLQVALDDAPRANEPADPGDPAEDKEGPAPDDLVVHEQDVHAVVNALWAGGARAVTVMGERVIATTALRCAGNTLLLHGVVYSPPFRIAAVGDPARLESALDAAPGVRLFRSYVAAYGLGYRLTRGTVRAPAYDGPLAVEVGAPAARPSGSSPSEGAS